jgi:hypothetical protein
MVPGYLMSVHVPDAGKPVRETLPVDTVQDGGTIVPIVGAPGVDGCGFITTFPDCEEVHPSELVTAKV